MFRSAACIIGRVRRDLGAILARSGDSVVETSSTRIGLEIGAIFEFEMELGTIFWRENNFEELIRSVSADWAQATVEGNLKRHRLGPEQYKPGSLATRSGAYHPTFQPWLDDCSPAQTHVPTCRCSWDPQAPPCPSRNQVPALPLPRVLQFGRYLEKRL